MAIDFMERIFIQEYDQIIKNEAYEYEEILSSPGNGKSIIIPDNIKAISITLEVIAGSGKVQATTNKLENVRNDSGITWIDWDEGVVIATIQDSSEPVTAIRQVNITGTTRILVRAQ